MNKPQFKSRILSAVPDFDEIASAVDAVSVKNDVPTVVKPSEQIAADAAANVTSLVRKEKPVRKSAKATQRKLSLLIPEYLAIAIENKRTINRTKRHVVLSAFKDAGYEVREADFMEDGRRGRE